MANDLLDHLMDDFSTAKATRAAAWSNLLKTGIAIDPNDTTLHSMMFYKKVPEGFQVVTVVPNGPADKAGVQKQDIILRVNDLDASALTLDELKMAMQRETFTLDLQRPGGQVMVTVHPQKYTEIVRILRH
jgi:C-terminal processing protease CtpA/Prc